MLIGLHLQQRNRVNTMQSLAALSSLANSSTHRSTVVDPSVLSSLNFNGNKNASSSTTNSNHENVKDKKVTTNSYQLKGLFTFIFIFLNMLK